DVENEWGMFYCQPWAVHAAGKAVMDANRIADKVVPFAKQKGDFAIVSDGAGLNDLYVACDFCDVNFDVVTDKMIRERPLDYRFIVACEDAALSEESLKKAEAAGVKIIRVKYGTDPKKINKTLKRYLKTAPKVKIDKWGAECRSYTDGSDTYFYVINHNKEPIDVTLPKEAENLLTGERVKDFRLESLGVWIMKL
ncbi:MAG: Beta-galactosidase C-terminal domain, partial [Abditibacteriota bacterium]|nr:Beta-galactosidase C-terminal domain [Abditibacteriota bacterium]